jgi:hypothetical protein
VAKGDICFESVVPHFGQDGTTVVLTRREKKLKTVLHWRQKNSYIGMIHQI